MRKILVMSLVILLLLPSLVLALTLTSPQEGTLIPSDYGCNEQPSCSEALSQSGGIATQYDFDSDGRVDLKEVLQAIADKSLGKISGSQVCGMIGLWQSDCITILCKDSDNSPDFYTNLITYPITSDSEPSLFQKGYAKGIYTQADQNLIIGEGNKLSSISQSPYPYSIYYDHCANDQQLNEAFCTTEGKLASQGVSCPNGCANGACLKVSTPKCTSDSECPSSQNTYCSGGSVCYESPIGKCINPGTDSAYCGQVSGQAACKICPNGCSSGECNPAPTCKDTDGLNYLTKTSVTSSQGNVWWDQCIQITGGTPESASYCAGQDCYLYEMLCSPVKSPEILELTKTFDGVYSAKIRCADGCNDGTCKKPTATCTDSDGGIDYYTKGKIEASGWGITYDSCFGENGASMLDEYYCNKDGSVGKVDFSCPNGCKDGACIKPAATCKDSDLGVDPYTKGICKDSSGVIVEDGCLKSDGSGPYPKGEYVLESYCMTPDMREYCKQFNGAEYCDNLPDVCYSSPFIPQDNLAWYYFPRNEAYFCENGCSNGACIKGTNPKCTSDSECTSSQKSYCSGNLVCVQPSSGKCINPGTNSAYCGTLSGQEACKMCPNGCSNGACITSTSSCSDTDGGINQFVKGTVKTFRGPDETGLIGIAQGVGAVKKSVESKEGYTATFTDACFKADDYFTLNVGEKRDIKIGQEKSSVEIVNVNVPENKVTLKIGGNILTLNENEVSGMNQIMVGKIFTAEIPYPTAQVEIFIGPHQGAGDYLMEFYCSGDNNAAVEYFKCENGCSDGACNQVNTKCISEGQTGSGFSPYSSNEKCCAGLTSVACATSDGDMCGVATDCFVCTNCGDGICGLGENQCNCAQDCNNCVGEGGSIPVIQNGPKCCAGLTPISPTVSSGTGECLVMIGAQVCTKCGDGICGAGENQCNCAEDCAYSKCSDTDGGQDVFTAGKVIITKSTGSIYTVPDTCVSEANMHNMGIMEVSSFVKKVNPITAVSSPTVTVASTPVQSTSAGASGGQVPSVASVQNTAIQVAEEIAEQPPSQYTTPQQPPLITPPYGHKTYVLEQYCNENGGYNTLAYECPYGCENGACITSPATCLAEGENGKSGFELTTCCEGLTSVPNSKFETVGDASGYTCLQPQDGSFVCTNCGDGICGLGENQCNCAQDCNNCVGEGGSIPVIPNGPKCCAGLTPISPSVSSGTGECAIMVGAQVCTQCGDGICGAGENTCNCAEDCKKVTKCEVNAGYCQAEYKCTDFKCGPAPTCKEGYYESGELGCVEGLCCLPEPPATKCEANGGYCNVMPECKEGYECIQMMPECKGGYNPSKDSLGCPGECCLPEVPTNTCETNGGKCTILGDLVEDTCEMHNLKTLPYSCQQIATNTQCCAEAIVPPTTVCSGCVYKEACLPIGTRVSVDSAGQFCDINKQITAQLPEDNSCMNNYECKSNLCVSDKCISGGFFTRIMEWFKSLFGG